MREQGAGKGQLAASCSSRCGALCHEMARERVLVLSDGRGKVHAVLVATLEQQDLEVLQKTATELYDQALDEIREVSKARSLKGAMVFLKKMNGGRVMSCSACGGGPLEELGILGRLKWLRCRGCGMQFSREMKSQKVRRQPCERKSSGRK